MSKFVFPQEKGNSVAMNGKILGPGKTTGGLTKRELFAALSMAALRISHPDCFSSDLVNLACADADALLAELEKEK